jgi:hypothetical protein
MRRLISLLLASLFVLSTATPLMDWRDGYRLGPNAHMEMGGAAGEVPEEAPETPDERPDTGKEWFGSMHPADLSGDPSAAPDGHNVHADDALAGLLPFELESPPPEA